MQKNKNKLIHLGILSILALIFIYFGFFRTFTITGDCMEPAVKDNQTLFVNKVSQYLRPYRINDLILYKFDEKIWISRIVALESNIIKIAEGNIIVNGVISQDIGIYRNWSKWKYGTYAIENLLRVPLDHVFVLSDNLSAQHDDSRVFGPIPKDSILGIVWSF